MIIDRIVLRRELKIGHIDIKLSHQCIVTYVDDILDFPEKHFALQRQRQFSDTGDTDYLRLFKCKTKVFDFIGILSGSGTAVTDDFFIICSYRNIDREFRIFVELFFCVTAFSDVRAEYVFIQEYSE